MATHTNSHSRHPSVEDRDDLVQIPSESLNEDAIAECLRTRHSREQPYTNCGSSALTVVNPGRYLSILGDETAKQHARQYRDVETTDQTELPPHLFGLATKIYMNLRRLGQDQAAIFSGIAGSGKTESHRALVRQLCLLAAHSKKDAKMHAQVQQAQHVLEAFGNVRSSNNPNASSYGLFEELQFNERGRVVGAKFLTFGFDKTRMLAVSPQERSFHAFYYLLAGATSEERQRWQLRDLSFYAYLRGRATQIPGVDDALRYQELTEAMRVCGIKSRARDQIFQLLSAILHLGELEFDDGELADDACVIRNHDQLEVVRGDVCTVLLNPESARQHRDAFACSLYSLLFTWLVECLNQKLCHEEETVNIVALLDPQGFRTTAAGMNNGRPNTTGNFETFLANFAAERVQAYVSRRAFEGPVDAEMRNDGIQVPRVMCVDNTACVELLRGSSNKEYSVVTTLDIESAKSESRRSEAQLVAQLNKLFSSHDNFTRPSVDNAWSIGHYAGQVTYVDSDTLVKNLDILSADLVNVCRNSKSPFISELFSSMAVATEANPRDSRAIVAAQQSSKPMRAPSRRVKRAATRRGGDAAAEADNAEDAKQSMNDGKQGVARQIDSTLEDLFAAIDECRTWPVYHLRPNDADMIANGAAPTFDNKKVKAQTRAMLLSELARQRQTAPDMTISFPHDEFLQRFDSLLRLFQLDASRSPREKISALAMIKGWSENDVLIGDTRVFLREAIWKQFEDALRQAEKGERAARKGNQADDDDVAAAAVNNDPTALQTASPMMAQQEQQQQQQMYHSNMPTPGMNQHNMSMVMPDAPFRGNAGYSASSYGGDNQSVIFNEDEYLQVRNHPGAYQGSFNGTSGPSSYYGGGPQSVSPHQQPYDDDSVSLYESVYHGARSQAGMSQANHLQNMWGENEETPVTKTKKSIYHENAQYDPVEDDEEMEETRQRRCWVCCTWALTWWIPECCIRVCGRMKREDVRMAWREKVAICLLIFLLCAIAMLYVVLLPWLLCPPKYLFTVEELSHYQGDDAIYVAVHGQIYDVTVLSNSNHGLSSRPVSKQDMYDYAGLDVTNLFPIPLTVACGDLVTNENVKVTGSIEDQQTVNRAALHSSDNVYSSVPDLKLNQANWYKDVFIPRMRRSRKGELAFDPEEVKRDGQKNLRRWSIINNDVIDLTSYYRTANRSDVTALTNKDDWQYLRAIDDLFTIYSGQDNSDRVQFINPPRARAAILSCLRNQFKIGVVDERKGIRCLLASYLLLATACFLGLVILVKFLAALQLGTRRNPEDHDKFVICQVPCYTEGEDSLQRAFESLAALNYDDKRKLIFVIADGMIVGSGNDRPTPRIVLDLLGVDPKYNPDPLPFKSVGEGANQLNYGKVYSGLYEYEGHVVPYLVVVKVGRPTERNRPGNRGKRDSQIVLMRFLNRVHFDRAMSPLELEIYHQLKNVIGVHPSFYEYILMVDADTQVSPQSLNRLISCMLHDQKIMGICGETRLANEDLTWATMIQVYEYYISHHMAKAFESLFGSVTCLPGCFCMYRVRTPVKNRPLIIADDVVTAYSENHVNTLHEKNLLSLGEDRYLTTLMLKHFPQYKMTFTPDATCETAAPEKWSILLSQRRRWINSTIHNLVELLFLEDLCGFCCFSMRFVVMVDLVGTITMPATLGYVIYLLYDIISKKVEGVPLSISWVSITILCAIYGFQAIIFILKRQWQHIGWMIIYLLAMPIFGFLLPIYSFWHFDDFSWGNTRVVVGENKKKKVIVVGEEEKYDPHDIPLRTWAQYEQDMWEKGTTGSQGSQLTSISRRSHSRAPGSVAGESVAGGSQYGGSQRGGNFSGLAVPGSADYHRQSQGFSVGTQSVFNGGAGGTTAGSVYMPSNNDPHRSMISHGGGGMARSEYDPSMAFGPSASMDEHGMARYSMISNTQSIQPQQPYAMSSVGGVAAMGGGYPSDEQLVAEIRQILSTSDLMTITKKQVREQLSQMHQMDMTPRKEFINKTIDMVLQGNL
ncbi:chitin synthase-domain-containing protein [Syncephalis plumigaleata]|nr:chitin synthase-domain-containing protein [Syncephalis plumigaleata]